MKGSLIEVDLFKTEDLENLHNRIISSTTFVLVNHQLSVSEETFKARESLSYPYSQVSLSKSTSSRSSASLRSATHG